MPDIHSYISPSYLHLLCKCPKSLEFDKEAVEEENEAATLGTIQHSLLEYKLNRYFSRECEEPDTSALSIDEIFEVEAVFNYIIKRYKRLKTRCNNPTILIEEKLILNDFLPAPSWGFVDFAVVTDSTIYVFDAKFGRVKVDTNDEEGNPNPQLLAYAGGCYFKFLKTHNINKVKLHICQPKLSNYPTTEVTAKQMLSHLMTVISPAAYKAFNGEGRPTPNSECKYCRRRNHCRAYAAEALAQLQLELTQPEMLTDDELDFLLPKIPQLKKWCDVIWNYAVKKSETTGRKWTGYSLANGRPTRVFTDEEQVLNKAKEAGIDIVEQSLMSVAQVEKVLGKEAFSNLLGEFVTYKPGKPNLMADAPSSKASLINEFKGDK